MRLCCGGSRAGQMGLLLQSREARPWFRLGSGSERPILGQYRFLALCLIAVSTVARAGHFPVTAAYGTPSACAAFAEGGIQAVETGDDVSAILVTPSDVAAVGLTCPADKADVKGTKVTAACTLAQDQPFKLVATIEENAPAKTVKYSSGLATVILNRCD
jgi:hypothetical protein